METNRKWEKKYRLLEDDTVRVWGETLYRIEALKDFAAVKKGEKGGFIEKESNLSQEGNCWVDGNAEVCGNAEIIGDAMVSEKADYYVSKNIWSSGRYFTYTRSNRMWKVGCFHGTGNELIKKAYKDGAVSGREYARIVRYVEAMYADLENDNSKN